MGVWSTTMSTPAAISTRIFRLDRDGEFLALTFEDPAEQQRFDHQPVRPSVSAAAGRRLLRDQSESAGVGRGGGPVSYFVPADATLGTTWTDPDFADADLDRAAPWASATKRTRLAVTTGQELVNVARDGTGHAIVGRLWLCAVSGDRRQLRQFHPYGGRAEPACMVASRIGRHVRARASGPPQPRRLLPVAAARHPCRSARRLRFGGLQHAADQPGEHRLCLPEWPRDDRRRPPRTTWRHARHRPERCA